MKYVKLMKAYVLISFSFIISLNGMEQKVDTWKTKDEQTQERFTRSPISLVKLAFYSYINNVGVSASTSSDFGFEDKKKALVETINKELLEHIGNCANLTSWQDLIYLSIFQDILSSYKKKDEREAREILERLGKLKMSKTPLVVHEYNKVLRKLIDCYPTLFAQAEEKDFIQNPTKYFEAFIALNKKDSLGYHPLLNKIRKLECKNKNKSLETKILQIKHLIFNGELLLNQFEFTDTHITPLLYVLAMMDSGNQHYSQELVELLLANGADPNVQDQQENTPLHWAISSLSPESVKLLLAYGADPNIKNKKNISPLADIGQLFGSCDRKSLYEMMELLLDAHADINAQDETGKTPLYWAVIIGDKELVHKLLKRGANPNSADFQNDTPLSFLHGIITSQHDEHVLTLIQLLLDYKADVNAQTRGETLLHCGVIQANKNLVQLMFDNGMQPDVLNNKGETPLASAGQIFYTLASMNSIQVNSWLETIQLLLDNQANVNAQDQQGRTFLDWAVMAKNKEMITLLLKRGANPTIQDKDNITSLLSA